MIRSMGITSPRAGATKCGWRASANGNGSPGADYPPAGYLLPGATLSPLRRTGGQDVTGWPANPKLVRHLKSTLIRTGVHVDEAVMGLSVHTDEDGGGDNPLLLSLQHTVTCQAPAT